MRKRVIGIVGMPGSGKGIVDEVARDLGISVVIMGDVIREEASERGLEPTPENLGKIMLDIRREGGPAVVARRCVPKIQGSPTDVVVVEGIRSLDEVEEFKKNFHDFTLISVIASPETRFQRLYRRKRTDDPSGWRDFLRRDLRELKVGVGSAIAMADYAIINEGAANLFKRKVRDVLKRFTQ